MPAYSAVEKHVGRSCTECGSSILMGDRITHSRRAVGAYQHDACQGSAPAPDGLTALLTDAIAPAIETRLTDRLHEMVTTATAGLDQRIQVALDSHTRQLEIRVADAPPIVVEHVHPQLPKLVWLVANRVHTMLVGPPGSGKTTAGAIAARACGLELAAISLTPQAMPHQVVGYMDATGNYRRTPIRDRYEFGGVGMFNELDNASGALLTAVNGILDGQNGLGSYGWPDGMIVPSPDFVALADGNTWGRGPTVLHPERRALDAATLDRFFALDWAYDPAMERAIALCYNPNAGPWVTWIQVIRQWVAEQQIALVVSPRASIQGARYTLPGSPLTRDDLIAWVFRGSPADTVAQAIVAHPLPEGLGA